MFHVWAASNYFNAASFPVDWYWYMQCERPTWPVTRSMRWREIAHRATTLLATITCSWGIPPTIFHYCIFCLKLAFLQIFALNRHTALQFIFSARISCYFLIDFCSTMSNLLVENIGVHPGCFESGICPQTLPVMSTDCHVHVAPLALVSSLWSDLRHSWDNQVQSRHG